MLGRTRTLWTIMLFLHLCKQTLQDLYLTKWNAALSASSDGLIYDSYKVMPWYSNYFNKIVIPKFRYAFVKFVTKNHRLPVVSGKWHRPRLYNQRMCEVCDVLGDEYHFLLVFKSLCGLRQRYIPEYYFKYPSMYTFIAFMSSDYVKTIRNLAAFVYSSFQRITLRIILFSFCLLVHACIIWIVKCSQTMSKLNKWTMNYVMGLRPLKYLYSYSVEIDFRRQCRRQILTTKVDPPRCKG